MSAVKNPVTRVPRAKTPVLVKVFTLDEITKVLAKPATPTVTSTTKTVTTETVTKTVVTTETTKTTVDGKPTVVTKTVTKPVVTTSTPAVKPATVVKPIVKPIAAAKPVASVKPVTSATPTLSAAKPTATVKTVSAAPAVAKATTPSPAVKPTTTAPVVKPATATPVIKPATSAPIATKPATTTPVIKPAATSPAVVKPVSAAVPVAKPIVKPITTPAVKPVTSTTPLAKPVAKPVAAKPATPTPVVKPTAPTPIVKPTAPTPIVKPAVSTPTPKPGVVRPPVPVAKPVIATKPAVSPVKPVVTKTATPPIKISPVPAAVPAVKPAAKPAAKPVSPSAHAGDTLPSDLSQRHSRASSVSSAHSSRRAPADRPPIKKALLIGVNYFDLPGNETATNVQDAINAFNFLSDRGYSNTNMRLLLDSDSSQTGYANTQNIIAGLQWLAREAIPGDQLFLLYSGKSSRQGADDAQGICPADFMSTGVLEWEVVFDLAVRRLPAGVRLMFLANSAYSGTILNLPYVYSISSHGEFRLDNSWKQGEAAMNMIKAKDAKSMFLGAKNVYNSFTSKSSQDGEPPAYSSQAEVFAFFGHKAPSIIPSGRFSKRLSFSWKKSDPPPADMICGSFLHALDQLPDLEFGAFLMQLNSMCVDGNKPRLACSHEVPMFDKLQL